MPLSGLTDEIEFKVFRSHVKIPMIFLVPAAFLLTLYVGGYLYANSAGFRTQLTGILHEQLGGHFGVKVLQVDATMTRVHLFDASVQTPEREPVIDVQEVRASFNPLMVLAGRVSVSRAVARGAHVRTEFDDQGRLGLLRALGVKEKDAADTPDAQADGRGISLEFAAIEVIDSAYSFGFEGLQFHVPSINLPHASITIEPQTILMHVEHLDLPRIDFRFSHELLHMSPKRGDWVFAVEDVQIRDWRWANDGFGVESASFWSEGVQVWAQGQMAFPGRDSPAATTMTYDGRGRVSVEYWSPLAQYFIGDSVHFAVPDFEIAVRGTLEQIEGGAQLFASHLETAGLRFRNVRGKLSLRDEWIDMREVSADIHGGRLEVSEAWVNIFEVMYGATGRFKDVNPRWLLQDFDVDLPFLDGRASGGFQVEGAVPFFPENPSPTDPYRMRDYATRRLAHVTVTEDWQLRRANRLLVPAARGVIKKGATTWVDFDRVVVPSAVVLLDGEAVRLDDFRFAYPTMTFEAGPDELPIRVSADIQDIGKWAAAYGLQGLHGPVAMQLDFSGPLAWPRAALEVRNARAPLRFPGTEVAADTLSLRAVLEDGRLRVDEAALETQVGHASLQGWVDLLASPARQRPKGAPLYALRPRQPADLSFRAHAVDLGALNRMVDFGRRAGLQFIPIQGVLSAQGTLQGSVQQPQLDFEMKVEKGSVQGQPVPQVYLKAATASVEGVGPAVVVKRFGLDAAGAGVFEARGHYGFNGTYGFELTGKGTRFERIVPVLALPAAVRPSGSMSLAVHGAGSLAHPTLGGHIQLRNLGVGAQQLGDIYAALNTVDESLYLVGAALPLATFQAKVPLGGEAPYSVKLGLEKLDLEKLGLGNLDLGRRERTSGTASAGGARVGPRSSATGTVELTVPRDLSSWRLRADLSEVEVATLGRGIRNDGPLRFEINDNVLHINRARIGVRDRYISAEGSIALDPLAFDVALTGQLDLSILNPLRSALPQFFPAAFVESSGALAVDARFHGPLQALQADGSMSFERAEFVVRGLSEPVQIDSGMLVFSGGQIKATRDAPLIGSAMGGIFSVEGALALGAGGPPALTAHAWSHNMSWHSAGTASVTFDTNLQLDAPDLTRAETWRLSGDVDVLDGSFHRDSSLIEREVTGRVLGAFNRQSQRYEANLFDQVPMLSKIQLELAVRARDGFRVDSQIDRLGLNLELRADLRLRDTLPDPMVSGDVEVISGVVGFQGEKFTVRSGTVRFAGELERPWIDVTAGADIRNRCREEQFGDDFQTDLTLSGDLSASRERYYHVMLHLNGYADNLDLQFESNPFADQRDILSLLLTGCTLDQLTASSASGPTLEIALGPLLGRIEREIQDVVKVNEFTIMPGVERTQVRIGDRISRRLSWNFQLDTGMNESAGGQRYQLEYKLSDRWALELSERSHSESSNFLLDLKLKYRLPLD